MPKIIEHLEQRLMEEARRQAAEGGYPAVTIRSVAEACGVGVGTVYNYYPSKDALLAAFLLQDWKVRVDHIVQNGAQTETVQPVLYSMWQQLHGFLTDHAGIFQAEEAAAGFGTAVGRYHSVLRQQLAQPLRPFCSDDFTAQFVAEAMITWTAAGKSFEALYPMVSKLF